MPENLMQGNKTLNEDVITFSCEINDETIGKLITHISNLNINTPLRIYFTTQGGYWHSGQIFINYINHLVDLGKKIDLIAVWEVSSTGFQILYEVKCKVQLLHTYSVIHIGTMVLDYRKSLQNNSIEAFHNGVLDQTNQELIKFYKDIGISKKEINDIKNGNNVFLNTKRIKQLLEKK